MEEECDIVCWHFEVSVFLEHGSGKYTVTVFVMSGFCFHLIRCHMRVHIYVFSTCTHSAWFRCLQNRVRTLCKAVFSTLPNFSVAWFRCLENRVRTLCKGVFWHSAKFFCHSANCGLSVK